MNVFVERILNRPIDSNSFVVYTKDSNSCVVIDPGTENCIDLLQFLEISQLVPEYIFLTHEHFDHIWGVNKLKDTFNCKIICSVNCSEKIIVKKKNLSLFFDQVGFETYPADINIEEIDNYIEWDGGEIEFITTQGHTDASICILIDNNLFTGDTIIKNSKTIVKLPGGSKSKLIKSLALLNNKFKGKQVIIHSGHGESFCYDELKVQEII
jgi:hydroxyacylglutathione hydrolase